MNHLLARACTSKGRYSTERKAQNAIANALKKRKIELHCYACEWCGGWHLTRKPSKKAAKKLRRVINGKACST